MIRFLPFILIPILIIAGLGYWRYSTGKQSLTTPKTSEQDQEPVEVPKALPGATVEERVKSLEDTIAKLVPQVNSLKVQASPNGLPASLDSRLGSLESAMTELKARVSALEKATPAPATSGKATIYIPLGAGGSWFNVEWQSLSEYEVSLNPDNYPGYTGMSLEANFRLVDPTGTGSVRLYNVTDGSAVSGQLDTTSATFALQTTTSFKLPSGTKTYRLQTKSSQRDLSIQSARIRVNF